MKRIAVLALAASFIAVLGLATMPQASNAGASLPDWKPLAPDCADVSGDGNVDLANDILNVILHFGGTWADPAMGDTYALVYDQNGDGTIDLANDVLQTILAFSPGSPDPDCSETDIQVIRSAVALMPYKDCQDAVADGYESTGVYVPQMGIHISKYSNLKTTFDPNNIEDLANPFGLVCTEHPDNPGQPDKLIGPWYIIPTTSTANVYNFVIEPDVQPPYQPDNTPPPGFATDEDYIPWTGALAQAGWHTHINLCVGQGLLHEQGPGGSQENCVDNIGGFINIPLYGWMLHLYNFVPNPAGRFMRWNENQDFPRCGYLPTQECGGGSGVAGEDATGFDGSFCPINLAFLEPEA